ncbi:MAG: hypothetical protein ABWW69_03970 [Pyrodictiaceae archaeon]
MSGQRSGKGDRKAQNPRGASLRITQRQQFQRTRERPMPFPDGRCNPLCPYFRCLNNALVVIRKQQYGKIHKAPFCRWIGDECMGGSCQYASCALKALLPDGRCLFAVEKSRKEEGIEEIERELIKEEREMSKIGRLMKRRGYDVDEE